MISIHKLCPQSVLNHSAVHFQGIGVIFNIFFQNMFCQNMWKSKISIHKLSPQPVVKHSVDHFQGIAMTFLKNKCIFSI